ncbi:RecQ family ATP-dependent DNA helicase [Aerococcus agrisoli]|uniref:RecQ family ATP-dependent DNA helicase n=1 Tax=Aerococcus agrisoli TaxID=2487350 RepID=A0A3N4GRK9_9LACT|nr:RecQ family ATP-dependent DNA helicase [Aerococcus agrisoli]RPA61270.1 RecQ family ATP-dependent DNA helicase [Aerococcus agrisoli]
MVWQTKLKQMTGYDHFKPGQAETLAVLEKGQNALAILPTGGGKSLIYQLYQYQAPGITVIVSPLISLMQDQVGQLQTMGLGPGIALNSTYEKKQQAYILHHLDRYKFVFISPEMLLKQEVRSKLKTMPIHLLVVDEAHCISQWGFDFRPEYTELKAVRQFLGNPLTLALSATASSETLQDIQTYLFEPEEQAVLIKESVDRPNIFYVFEELGHTNERETKLLEWLAELPKPGIVYVHHKSELEALTKFVKAQTEFQVASYHGDRTLADRHIIQNQFINGRLDVVFATSAFGMGINHPNIRFVLHYHLPKNIADFVQEIGRAGRDQDQAVAVVLYDQSERARLQQIRRVYEEEADLLESLLGPLFDGRLTVEMLDRYSDSIAAMLRFYKHHFRNLTEAKAHAQKLRQTKMQQIYQMLDLMNHDGCYRELLLHHADETLEKKPDLCCTHCNSDFRTHASWLEFMHLPKVLQFLQEHAPNETNKFAWRTRLDELFS